MKKRLVSLIMGTIMVVSCGFSSFAAENKKVYTIQEYEEILQAEGEKYGIDCEVQDYDPNVEITEEVLERGLENLKRYAESREVDEETLEKTNLEEGVKVSRVAPINRVRTASFSVSNAYGRATMVCEVDATMDIQGGNIMYVNSIKVYQQGSFLNFQSWTTTSTSYTKNSPSRGWVQVAVKGRATFSYADPVTGILTGYTSNESKTVNVNFN